MIRVLEATFVTLVLSLVLSSLMLLLSLLCVVHPKSRRYLDRVSFRLLIAATFGLLVYNVANYFIIFSKRAGSSNVCHALIHVTAGLAMFSAAFLFSIGLNLQLVMIHGVNGRKAEKWYYIVTIGMTVMFTALHLHRDIYWDPTMEICLVSQDAGSRETIISWGSVSGILFCTVGEIVTFLCIMVFMLRNMIIFKPLPRRTLSQTSSSGIGTWSIPRLRPQTRFTSGRYRLIIFRIALYPLVAAIANAFVIGVMVKVSKDALGDILLVLAMVRPVVYGVLALFDPSLLRALKAIFRVYFPSKERSSVRFATRPPVGASERSDSHGSSQTITTIKLSTAISGKFSEYSWDEQGIELGEFFSNAEKSDDDDGFTDFLEQI